MTPSAGRRHKLLPHTADAGLRATAPTIDALFEEAAAALGELAVDFPASAPPTAWEDVVLEADDLPGLAYGWLNELIALADIHRAAVVAARVEQLGQAGADDGADVWRLRARVGLLPYGANVRPIRQPKSATYHGLRVERRRDNWMLEAYVDL